MTSFNVCRGEEWRPGSSFVVFKRSVGNAVRLAGELRTRSARFGEDTAEPYVCGIAFVHGIPPQRLRGLRLAGQRNRGHRPQGSADEQSRALGAAGHAVPRRGHRPPARPAAGQDLLPADDRTRRHPPQGLLRRRRAPRRTSLDDAAPWHPVRDLRQQRQPRSPGEAGKIVAERWTVPEDVRKRRRSRKMAGKVPQAAATGPTGEATLPAPDRRDTAPRQSSPHLTRPPPASTRPPGGHAGRMPRSGAAVPRTLAPARMSAELAPWPELNCPAPFPGSSTSADPVTRWRTGSRSAAR